MSSPDFSSLPLNVRSCWSLSASWSSQLEPRMTRTLLTGGGGGGVGCQTRLPLSHGRGPSLPLSSPPVCNLVSFCPTSPCWLPPSPNTPVGWCQQHSCTEALTWRKKETGRCTNTHLHFSNCCVSRFSRNPSARPHLPLFFHFAGQTRHSGSWSSSCCQPPHDHNQSAILIRSHQILSCGINRAPSAVIDRWRRRRE